MFVIKQQDWANEKLRAKGFLFLNENEELLFLTSLVNFKMDT